MQVILKSTFQKIKNQKPGFGYIVFLKKILLWFFLKNKF